MIFHSLIVDDFFEDPALVRSHALSQSYEGVVNPADRVLYPDISIMIPSEVKEEILWKIEKLLGIKIEKSVEFIRLSKKGVKAPHHAHTDLLMGDYTALLYLTAPEYCQGGTTLLKHRSGMETNPTTEEGVRMWKKDANDDSSWEVIGNCPMKFNRLFLARSDLFHRAEPVDGFGEGVEDGRLVLVAFLKGPGSRLREQSG